MLIVLSESRRRFRRSAAAPASAAPATSSSSTISSSPAFNSATKRTTTSTSTIKTRLSLCLFLLLQFASASDDVPLSRTDDKYSSFPRSVNRRYLRAEKRIVGGTDATITSAAYFASLFWTSNHRWSGCGGSLIGPKHILTAAHCVQTLDATKYAWKVGAYCGRNKARENCGAESDFVYVDSVTVFPGYETATEGNDIAVMRLNRTTSQTYIEVDDGSALSTGDVVVARGFGLRSNNPESFSDKLQEVRLKYIPNDACRGRFPTGMITDDMMCSGGDAGLDTCNGDSGGPITLEGAEEGKPPVLVGVTSWGSTVCASGTPGVGARVGFVEHARWIRDVVCDEDGSKAEERPSWCHEVSAGPDLPGGVAGVGDVTNSTGTGGTSGTTTTPAGSTTSTTTTSAPSVVTTGPTQEISPPNPPDPPNQPDDDQRAFPLNSKLMTCGKLIQKHPLIRHRICTAIEGARRACPNTCNVGL